MQRRRRRWLQALRRWPGVTGDGPAFVGLADNLRAGRVWAATLGGSAVLIGMAGATHSAAVGYGYGFAVFSALSWPLLPRVLHRLIWTELRLLQGLLLLLASVGLGSLGDALLGLNPQAGGLERMSWPLAAKLLWEFPLLLPVENLMLLGILVALWNSVQPRRWVDRLAVAMMGSLFFGLWHVPFWGWGTMLVVGLSVVPWSLYILATGDMVAPVVAHLLMDSLALLAIAAPSGSLAHRYAMPAVVLGVVLLGTGQSLWRDVHYRSVAPRPPV
ncbi:MAG: CPBP family glutamic-type intramembrane protease [Thermaerobacter sp.]|nr:CPBP family glutamic-type intramembrane protease [Thermaerobacter sp.]